MTTLNELIDAHKAAAAAFEAACLRLETVNDEYDDDQEENPVTVKIGLINARADEGAERLNIIADDVCEKLTRDVRIIDSLSPSFAMQFQAAIAGFRAELTTKIEAALAEEESRQEAFGLAAARREWERLNEAEEQALLAVCRHRCATIEEEQARLRYVLADPSFRGCGNIADDCANALLQAVNEYDVAA